jgi:hypothetical protein
MTYVRTYTIPIALDEELVGGRFVDEKKHYHKIKPQFYFSRSFIGGFKEL